MSRRIDQPLARTGPQGHPRRDAGVVERGGLENRCARERTEGSNPSLSASDLPIVVYDCPNIVRVVIFNRFLVRK